MTNSRHREELVSSIPTTSFLSQTINYDRWYEFKEMDDVVTLNFVKRREAGEVIINPLLYRVEKKVLPDDTASYTSTYPGYPSKVIPDSASANLLRSIVGYSPQSGNILAPDPLIDEGSELDLLKQTCFAFVDDPEYGFGEDLLSIRETIASLANPLRSVDRLMKAFHKKAYQHVPPASKSTPLERAEAIAGLWAQYSFEIYPLMESIENIYMYLEKDVVQNLRRTSRSRKTLQNETFAEFSGAFNGSSFFKLPKMYGSGINHRVRTIEYRVGLIYEASFRDTMIEHLGLRSKDLVVAAYEVIPLSFMLDRIINVKRSIQSLINFFDPNVKILGGFVTKRDTESSSHLMTSWSFDLPEFTVDTFAPLPHVEETFTLTREKWDPSLGLAIPILNPGRLVDSAHKVADLASLLVLNLSAITKTLFGLNIR